MSNELAEQVLEMCKYRGWSLHWTARGAYLHLEASELIEALRGKRGTPLEEAGDVLLVLMSITEHQGISWHEVVEQASKKCESLMTKPPYPREERACQLSEADVLGAIKDLYPDAQRGVTMAMLCEDLEADYLDIQPALFSLKRQGLIREKPNGNGWEPKNKMPWTPNQPQGFA